MSRSPLFLAFLLSLLALPAFAATPAVLELLPDGNGGATAFVFTANKIATIPIDAAGALHPERAENVLRGLPRFWVFDIGKTTDGYLMSFSDEAATACNGDLC